MSCISSTSTLASEITATIQLQSKDISNVIRNYSATFETLCYCSPPQAVVLDSSGMLLSAIGKAETCLQDMRLFGAI
jgi:hypothetical protein